MNYKLYHFSDKPFIFNDFHTYRPHRYNLKPAGLWLSVNDDWAKWCYNNDYMLNALEYRTEFVISDTSRICYLRSERDVDAFIDNYRYIYNPMPMFNTSFQFYTIHWDEVKQDYDGIFIDEDNKELREYGFKSGGMNTWIDTWDCLSGCVWNFDIIHQKESEKFNLKKAIREWNEED